MSGGDLGGSKEVLGGTWGALRGPGRIWKAWGGGVWWALRGPVGSSQPPSCPRPPVPPTQPPLVPILCGAVAFAAAALLVQGLRPW